MQSQPNSMFYSGGIKNEQSEPMSPSMDEPLNNVIDNMVSNTHVPENGYKIQIVEQPPERSVYKRNLKPNPTVMLLGELKPTDNVYVAVVLVRCDTFEEEPRFLTGNRPVKLPVNRLVTFKKLKVLTTSHQQQESLFSLRFEARKYVSETQYDVLTSATSTPICVLSHSTQMKPAPSAVPTLMEIIPSAGPCSGGTRVAIVGRDFVDSPAARVRFDYTEVMPSFHGPGTLVCHTPQHEAGQAHVRVCTGTQKWSDTEVLFNYGQQSHDNMDHGIMVNSADGNTDLGFSNPNSNVTMGEAAWHGNIDQMDSLQQSGLGGGHNGGMINGLDQRQYAPLHYAAARGHVSSCQALLRWGANVNVLSGREQRTALQWAVLEGQLPVVSLLCQQARLDLDHQDRFGHSALHLCLTSSLSSSLKTQISRCLLLAGASHALPDADPELSGATPIHVAAAFGFLNILQLFLWFNASLTVQDNLGETPLAYAEREEQRHTVQFLKNQQDLFYQSSRLPLSSAFDMPLRVNVFASTNPRLESVQTRATVHEAISNIGSRKRVKVTENLTVLAMNA